MKLPKILREIGRLADKANIKIYVVGGFVRDLLLGAEDADIDIVVESNAINFAKVLADKYRVKFIRHEGFKTATIKMGGFRIDIATARKERYKKPAVLPEVEPAAIKEDLSRRDFTINAMAVPLNAGKLGQLVDFFNGRDDLKNRIIRVLHDLSFIDDPTRILRAVRFEQRLGFRIEPHTRDLIAQALRLDMIAKLKPQRLKKEIVLISAEPNFPKMVLRLRQLGVDIGTDTEDLLAVPRKN